VAGDVAITGMTSADVTRTAPGEQMDAASPGEDGEVTTGAEEPRRAASGPLSADSAEARTQTALPGVSGGTGVRRRLARLGAPRGGGVNPVLEPLIKTVRATHPKADVRLIERAYEVAAHWHDGQMRKSGDPYITHPLAVATILAELGMNQETICAALLHDTIEDTAYKLNDLRREFGDDVAALVDGVTKLDKVKYGEAAEAETVRKMVVAMSRDIRVLVIKLADRLHNMRTLRYLSRAKQERKSREVLEIFAPLAHRLGMNTIKWELEDLAFATMYPKRYDEIARMVSERAPRRDLFLQEVIEEVSADLREAKIKARVTGRPKHYYSVYQKMIARNVGFDDIYDLVGIRVLVDSVRDCYAALGTIHARWNPIPGRFKDYIAMPKFNMYQSLHTTVIGPEGKPVELQIRTWGMHRRAEYGVAAHWKYKEESVVPAGRAGNGTSDMAWLRQLVDWQRETADPAEFLESLRFDLGAAEVYVFTPKGEVIALPAGATPVDFAYAIHTEVGHRTIGARVNGRLVALESALDNGDTVEIFTSRAQDAAPSRDWLTFVKSARARNKIRHWFSKERREAATEAGKTAIARAIRKHGLPLQRPATGDALLAIATELRYPDLSALYAAVGENHVSAQSVVTKLVQSLGGLPGAQDDLAEATLPTRPPRPRPARDSGVAVEGADDVWARLSRCCTPVPGDEITGFVTRGHGVSVHRANCDNLRHLLESEPERLVAVRWAPTEDSLFLVAIQVEALDRTGLLSDVTRAISDQHVNILSASVTTSRDRVAVSKFAFEMGDPKHLGHVLRAVRAIDGVYDAYRVTS
jgi:GTP diphosphokinase / guanosine-3',5'-bis(diphosphate) 3'-diphosphatase